MGSSRTRDRTCVPCLGRRILNHCATREVPPFSFNCAAQHSSRPSRFLSPVSWVHLCLLPIPGLLLPCLPSPSLSELKVILNTELFSLFAWPLSDRICSPFTAEESQALTSLLPLTRQVSCARHCSDMGETAGDETHRSRPSKSWHFGWGWGGAGERQ